MSRLSLSPPFVFVTALLGFASLRAADSAEFLTIDLPQVGACSSIIPVTVTVLNTGDTTWTPGYAVQMRDSGLNLIAYATIGVTTPPGATATVTLQPTLASAVGACNYFFYAWTPNGGTFGWGMKTITLQSVDNFVKLSRYNFPSANPPVISTTDSALTYLGSTYKLRTKVINVPGYADGFHAATSWNNQNRQLDTLPPPATYPAQLYWLKYDSTGNYLQVIGQFTNTTVSIDQSRVQLTAYWFNQVARPSISCTQTLPPQYKLAAQVLYANQSTLDGATAWNNQGHPIDQLPPPGQYTVKLYWQKFDVTGTSVTESGVLRTEDFTVTDGPAYILPPQNGHIDGTDWTDDDGNSGTDYSADVYDLTVPTGGKVHIKSTGLINLGAWLMDPTGNIVYFSSNQGNFDFTATAIAGVYRIYVFGQDSDGDYGVSATLDPTTPPPAINSPAQAVAAVGVPFTYSITATNSPTAFYAGGLPLGLTCSPATGIINGTTNIVPGAYNVQLYAVNPTGAGPTTTLTLNVGFPPTIATAVTDQVVYTGDAVTLSVVAGGQGPFTYQWQKDGVDISGATSASLNIASASTTAAGTYTVIVSNGYSAVISSAVLTVHPPGFPRITLQPVSRGGDAGSTVQLHVEATGDPAPSFLWMKSGLPLLPDDNHFGEARNRFTLVGLKASDAGTYSVTVSNSAGSIISNGVTVSVNTVSPVAMNLAPIITQQPSNQYVAVGATPNLSVQATGIGQVKYRWFKNGAVIAGAANRTLAFSAGGVTSSDYGSYRVEASNEYGATSSRVVALGQPQAPAITDVSVAVVLGVPVNLDLLAENPQASRPAPPTSWTFSSLPAAGLTLNPSTGRITGTPTQIGSISGIYSATNDAGTGQAQLKINALSTSSLPVIISQPSALIVGSGQPFSLTCSAATVAAPLQFQWRKQGQALTGATLDHLDMVSAQSGDEGDYDVVITNPNGSVTSQTATITLTSGNGTGSAPSAAFSFPLTVTKATVAANEYSINEQASITTVVDALESAGTISATVGDKITIRFTAADVDGDLKVNMLKVIAPDVAGTGTTGNWNYAADRFWVDPNKSGPVDNPFVYVFPKDDTNRSNPVTREVSFVLDAAGIWKFRVQATDESGKTATLSTKNSLDIQVRNPVLSTNTTAVSNPYNRLVGAYFNAGQLHGSAEFQDKWLALGSWAPSWGPNLVSPLITDWRTGNNPAKNILYQYYLGWAAPGPVNFLTAQDDSNTARAMAAELAYSGVDFVVIDHTNLVFTYGDKPLSNFFVNDTDNPVTRAATALKDGFRSYALGGDGVPGSNVRIKIAFMLGLTTAWFVDGMDGGNPSTELVIRPDRARVIAVSLDNTRDILWGDITLSEFKQRRINRFNQLLQTIWDNYAQYSDVWQYDPDNGRPLLFLYVGTDGPAIYRNEFDGTLDQNIAYNINSPLCMKVSKDPLPRGANPSYLPIDQVFSIKYVAAGMACGFSYDAPLRNGVTTTPFQDRVSEMDTFGTGDDAVTRRYYLQHWSFREIGDTAEPVGTLSIARNTDGTIVAKAPQVVSVTNYRSTGPGYFASDLDAAVKLKPRILMLASWNEFGSTNDEPSPEMSWTIMPNNKYGRKYSEILRAKVISYKGAP